MEEKNKTTIIIGDDNLELCKQMKSYLQNFKNLEILGVTSNGEEQLEMIKVLKPNIVITDLKRDKGISGFEVLKKCHELQLTESKFIVATAAHYHETISKLNDIGINHILFKPFTFDNLIQEIEEIQNEEDNSLTIVNNDICPVKKNFIDLIRQMLTNFKIIK